MVLKAKETLFNKNFLEMLERLDLKKVRRKFLEFKEKVGDPSINRDTKISYLNIYDKLIIEVLDTLGKRATWLNDKQRGIIVMKVNELVRKKVIGNKEAVKLLGILCGIPYAEMMQDKHGILGDYIYDKFFKPFLKTHGEPRSYTLWQVPVVHIEKLFVNKFRDSEVRNKFYKILDDEMAVEVVIKIILENIGLSKSIKQIFAEYNHKRPYNTEIATLQIFLNSLRMYATKLLHKIETGEFGEVGFIVRDIDYVLGDSNLSGAMDSHDKRNLSQIIGNMKHDLSKGKNEMVAVLGRWPECDIDGDFGNQVVLGLSAAKEFFGSDIDFEKKEIKDLMDLHQELLEVGKNHNNSYDISGALYQLYHNYKFTQKLGLSGIHSIPTHSPVDKKELEEIFDSIMRHKDKSEGVLKVLREMYSNLKHRDDEIVIFTLRRFKFKNPFNVYNYVKWGKVGYTIVVSGARL